MGDGRRVVDNEAVMAAFVPGSPGGVIEGIRQRLLSHIFLATGRRAAAAAASAADAALMGSGSDGSRGSVRKGGGGLTRRQRVQAELRSMFRKFDHYCSLIVWRVRLFSQDVPLCIFSLASSLKPKNPLNLPRPSSSPPTFPGPVPLPHTAAAGPGPYATPRGIP